MRLTQSFIRKVLVVLCVTFFYPEFSGYSQCDSSGFEQKVINGDFENGDDGSSSFGVHVGFKSSDWSSSPGIYYIGSNVATFNRGLESIDPYDGVKMLMIDAATIDDAICWEQTVYGLLPKDYYFSAWIASLSNSERCNLEFHVKGEYDGTWTVLGDRSFLAPEAGHWEQFFETWNPGGNTSATIRLVNNNPGNVGYNGNDYALDGISFTSFCGDLAGPIPDLNEGLDTIPLCNFNGVIDLKSGVEKESSYGYSWYIGGAERLEYKDMDTLASITEDGMFVVCVDSSTCAQVDTIYLSKELNIDIGTTEKLQCGESVNLGSYVPDLDYLWPDGSMDTIFTVSNSGNYKLKLSNQCGMAFSTFRVLNVCDCDVFVPNAFSPNGDGYNDELFVRSNCIKNLTFIVYDRWGKKVFQSKNVDNGWDGTFHGAKLNTGVFVYFVNALDARTEEIVTKKGNVSLIR